MKTYRITELSDEAQQNAIEEYRHRNWVYDEEDDTIVAHMDNEFYEFDEEGELID